MKIVGRLPSAVNKAFATCKNNRLSQRFYEGCRSVTERPWQAAIIDGIALTISNMWHECKNRRLEALIVVLLAN